MERPGHADDAVKQPPVRLHVKEQAEQAVSRDRENAVERKKIRRERDPEITARGHDVSAFAADAKTADASAH